ncbi:MAG TPA: hypothetical protein VED63_10735 [Acidimicrobiales bacterium]|nr:hypothetical protein [Acidimicrobiales bacterium]
MAWVWAEVRFLWRFHRRRSTATCSSAPAVRNLGDRRAATATEYASLGSFFCDLFVASTRTRAESVGGTSNTSSPTSSSC